FTRPDVAPITFRGTASSPLDFPHRVTSTTNDDEKEDNLANNASQQRLDCRRPCRVQMQVRDMEVPLVVYHAPNGDVSSLYGTLIGCAVDELQGDDCVYAGD